MADNTNSAVERFIARWQNASWSERANYRLFVPRAAEIAEIVLWIGYFQWHFRTRGQVIPPLPVLKDFHRRRCTTSWIARCAPLKEDAIAACFTGRGAWRKRLPQIIDTLVGVGRVHRGKDGLAVTA